MTETAVSFTVTGTETLMIACEPEAAPSEPLVDAEPESRDEDGEDALSLELVDESPITDTAASPMVTGTSTFRSAWVPESSPSSPDVVDSAACAAAAPKSVMPPAWTKQRGALFT